MIYEPIDDIQDTPALLYQSARDLRFDAYVSDAPNDRLTLLIDVELAYTPNAHSPPHSLEESPIHGELQYVGSLMSRAERSFEQPHVLPLLVPAYL